MYADGEQNAPESPLNWRTFAWALLIHLLAALLLTAAARLFFRPPEAVIPIDMTIVPPWAEQKPDDPEPDPHPPPPPERPKPPPPPVEEPPKIEETKQDAVVREKPKPKPKKEFKRSTKLVKNDKKRQEKKERDFRKNAKLVKAPPTAKYGKATAHDKPMTEEEFRKWMNAGARIGSRNVLASSEEQRCLSLIRRKFYESWDVPAAATAYPSVQLTVRFDAGGRIVGYRIARSSGSAELDRSVLAAAKRAGYVAGLTPDFVRTHPEITLDMKPE